VSKPNYLRKGDAPASILVKAENFVIYLFNITNNEKQFPKAYRYTLVSDIRTTALNMHKNITKALSIHPRYKKELKQRRKFQQRAYLDIVDLKALLTVAMSTVKITNPEYIALQLDIIIDGYVRWLKNDKRNYRKLPTRKEYLAHREEIYKARAEAKLQAKLEWESMDRDIDGFIVLHRRMETSI
jgi:hypothetical protein